MKNLRSAFRALPTHVGHTASTVALMLTLCAATQTATAQRINVGTNLLYWATTTPNVHVEWLLGGQYTLSATLAYNAFNYHDSTGSNPKLHHTLVYPEIKYWRCAPFERDYFGLHAFYGVFNAGGLEFPSFLDTYRYKGFGAGIGLSYGYQWAFGGRWGLEASIGVGYVYLSFDKYECGSCGDIVAEGERHYVLPTKLALTLVYFIK